MSLPAVAKKDLQDTVRSRAMVVLVVLFSALVSVMAYAVRPAGEGQGFETEILLSFFVGPILVTTLVPLVAVVIGYNAVSGERESGSLKLLLSLPHSRADVVFGKVIGRAAALSLAIAVGFLVPAVVLIAIPVAFNPGAFLGYTVFAMILGCVFVSIAVGCSAAASTQRQALIGGIGIYFVFVLLWGTLTGQLLGAFESVIDPLPVSLIQVQTFLEVANPNTGIQELANAFLADQLFAGETRNQQISATAMLVFWALAPPLVGLLKFDRDDL